MDEKTIEIQGTSLAEVENDLKYLVCKKLECPTEVVSEANPVILRLKITKPKPFKALLSCHGWGPSKGLAMFNMLLEVFPELLEEIFIEKFRLDSATTGSALHYLLLDVMFLRCWLARALIEKGMDPNGADSRGRTPLHICAGSSFHSSFRTVIVKFLLAHGADVHAVDKEGRTPLHYAVMYADSQTPSIDTSIPDTPINIVIKLIEQGSDVFALDNSGSTPFSKIKRPELFKIFIEHGGVLDLQTAISMGLYDEVVKRLDAGEDVNMIDSAGHTPLAIAIGFRQIPIVKVLLEYGANPNALVPSGPLKDFTLLQTTAFKDFGDIPKLLLEYGADPLIRDPLRHLTAEDIARERGCWNVVRVLSSPNPPKPKTTTPDQEIQDSSIPSKDSDRTRGFVQKIGSWMRKNNKTRYS